MFSTLSWDKWECKKWFASAIGLLEVLLFRPYCTVSLHLKEVPTTSKAVHAYRPAASRPRTQPQPPLYKFPIRLEINFADSPLIIWCTLPVWERICMRNPFSEAIFDEKLESSLEVFGIYSVDKI